MLEKIADLPYNEFERNFKRHIMEPLADTILTKTIYNSKHVNRRSPKQHPKFQLQIGGTQPMQTYIAKQQEDKSFMAPIRTVLVADDAEFHSFIDVYIRDHIAKYQSLTNKQVDFRVYLVPNRGISTLAHFIAMRDDLYCNNVYLPTL